MENLAVPSRPRVAVDCPSTSMSPEPEANQQANSSDTCLTRDEDEELRRLHWFSEVGTLADRKHERIVALRLRDRRKEIRPPRDSVAEREETGQSN